MGKAVMGRLFVLFLMGQAFCTPLIGAPTSVKDSLKSLEGFEKNLTHDGLIALFGKVLEGAEPQEAVDIVGYIRTVVRAGTGTAELKSELLGDCFRREGEVFLAQKEYGKAIDGFVNARNEYEDANLPGECQRMEEAIAAAERLLRAKMPPLPAPDGAVSAALVGIPMEVAPNDFDADLNEEGGESASGQETPGGDASLPPVTDEGPSTLTASATAVSPVPPEIPIPTSGVASGQTGLATPAGSVGSSGTNSSGAPSGKTVLGTSTTTSTSVEPSETAVTAETGTGVEPETMTGTVVTTGSDNPPPPTEPVKPNNWLIGE